MRKLNYFPLVVLVIFSVLLDYYVFGGVQALAGILSGRRPVGYILYWLLSGAILFAFIYMLSRVFPARKFSLIFNISFNTFLTVFVSKLVFAAMLFGEDIYRLVVTAIDLFRPGTTQMPHRSALFSQIALVTSAIPFFSFLFGITWGKYYYRVRRTVIFFDDLPSEFENFTIAQISDIHAGSFNNSKAVQRGVNLISAQNPDLLVFTGDLVNNKASEIVPYIEMLKQVNAPYGKYSILGNHDYGDYMSWENLEEKRLNLMMLKHYHAEMGFRLLLDEHAQVKKDGQQISVLGVENWGKGFGERGDLKKALNGVDGRDFKILLSHDPSHWDAQVKNNPIKIHLTFSGHTHGMQFGIEIGKFKWSPAKYRYQNWAGLAKFNDRYLYVNRGFGFLGFAGRIGIWPEITIIHLKRSVN